MKHPTGLKTLFFTEMWERMSFYGMRGILVLFMTASLSNADWILAMHQQVQFMEFMLQQSFSNITWGWIGDNILGQQNNILWRNNNYVGHLSLAIPNMNFYLGLILVVLGTGH